MSKYTMETGLNLDGQPVIKCSPDCYDELIKECRELLEVHRKSKSLRDFVKTYPVVSLLATMPTMAEILNSN